MPNHDDLLSQEDKPDYQQILKDKLTFSQSLINSKFPQATTKIIHSRLKQIMDFKEDKIFTMFVAQSLDFFTTQWNYVSQKLPLLPINFKQSVANMVQYRINNVLRDLIEDKIQIQPLKPVVAYNYDSDQKNGKLFILKGQSQQIRKKMLEINNSLKSLESQQMQENELITGDAKDLFAHLYSEQKKKQVEQFIKKKKEQKEQRKKKLQLQRLKEQQQLQQKEKQIKQQEQQQKKQRRQQQLKKNLQLHQKRDQQKASREQKSEEYQKKLKQINEKPRLFELLQKNFEKRKQYEQMEKKHQMKNEKKSIFLNIDDLKIEDHQKKYEQVRKMKQEQRQKRYAEYIQNQQKSRVRHHSSFELSRPTDKQLEQKQRAKQKYQKIKHYQSIVRQKFKPKVDQDKKKEMQTMIQQLQLNSRRKLKKTKLQNGAVVYQEIKEADPRSLGILYLQKTKQMAAKAKLIKATSSSVDLQPQLPKKKQIDYLQELRKNPKPRTSRRLSFIDRPNMSFDEKVNKMLIESQKLNDLVKQNEERLKFGKFKTSQQILNCKQEIDQSYLSIAKMKLKLIKDQ